MSSFPSPFSLSLFFLSLTLPTLFIPLIFIVQNFLLSYLLPSYSLLSSLSLSDVLSLSLSASLSSSSSIIFLNESVYLSRFSNVHCFCYWCTCCSNYSVDDRFMRFIVFDNLLSCLPFTWRVYRCISFFGENIPLHWQKKLFFCFVVKICACRHCYLKCVNTCFDFATYTY